MNQLSRQEFLDLFDPEVHEPIATAVKRFPDAEAVVCFENQDMWSSQLGARTAVIVGPSNTFQSVENAKGKWLNDLPSQRQYASSYVSISDYNI